MIKNIIKSIINTFPEQMIDSNVSNFNSVHSISEVPLIGTQAPPLEENLIFSLGVSEGNVRDIVNNTPISCTRASTAWAYDQNGNFQEIASNAPVVEWISGVPWLRAEPQRTNYQFSSNDLSGWFAVDFGGSTVTSTPGLGGVDYWNFIPGNVLDVQSFTGAGNNLSGSTVYTVSFRVKQGAHNYVSYGFAFYGDGGGIYLDTAIISFRFDTEATGVFNATSATAINLGNGYYEIIAQLTTPANTEVMATYVNTSPTEWLTLYPSYQGDGSTIGASFSDFQFEKGSTKTSRIVTGFASKTRNADLLTWSLSADQISSLSAQGQVTAEVMFGVNYDDLTTTTNHGQLVRTDQGLLYLYRGATNAQLIIGDGTGTSAVNFNFLSNTSYAVASDWNSSTLQMRVGFDNNWGAYNPFDGDILHSGTGYLMRQPPCTEYMSKIKWWSVLQSGLPNDGI